MVYVCSREIEHSLTPNSAVCPVLPGHCDVQECCILDYWPSVDVARPPWVEPTEARDQLVAPGPVAAG